VEINFKFQSKQRQKYLEKKITFPLSRLANELQLVVFLIISFGQIGTKTHNL